jgi:hypothetical protein
MECTQACECCNVLPIVKGLSFQMYQLANEAMEQAEYYKEEFERMRKDLLENFLKAHVRNGSQTHQRAQLLEEQV